MIGFGEDVAYSSDCVARPCAAALPDRVDPNIYVEAPLAHHQEPAQHAPAARPGEWADALYDAAGCVVLQEDCDPVTRLVCGVEESGGGAGSAEQGEVRRSGGLLSALTQISAETYQLKAGPAMEALDDLEKSTPQERPRECPA